MKFSPALFTRLFLSLAAWLCVAEVASAQTPSNDNFVSRSLLTGNSPSTTGSNVNATAETGEPFTWTGRNSVWWAWTAPSSGTAVIRTFYSTFDTTLAVHRGTSVSALTTLASNDDDPITLQSHLEIPVTAAVQYQIQVSSHGGQSGVKNPDHE
jgi:hypothetical protein